MTIVELPSTNDGYLNIVNESRLSAKIWVKSDDLRIWPSRVGNYWVIKTLDNHNFIYADAIRRK